MIGNARAEEVRGESPINTAAENVGAVIAAKIRNSAQPIIDIVGDRSAAAIQANAVRIGGGWIGTNVRVSRENIDGFALLRLRTNP